MKSLTAFVSIAFVAGLTLSLSAGQQAPAFALASAAFSWHS